MNRKLALVTGGYSSESTISYESAINIAHSLHELFDIFLVDINKSSWTCEKQGIKVPIDKDDFSATFANEKIVFDFAYICIHGTPGEDGKLQSYFDMIDIPYISSNSSVSMLTFNKSYTKSFLKDKDIITAKEIFLQKNIPYDIHLIQSLELPLFVKPNTAGSSFGISKVNHSNEINEAIQKAFKESNEVLIEEFIPGREFTIGVFHSTEGIKVLPITEIITHNEFFDFEAKYKGQSDEITPAHITDMQKQTLEAYAKKVYQCLDCRGVVRMEFIWHQEKEKPYFLEVNTIPGFTANSLIPQQITSMGMTQTQFLTLVIEQTLNNK